MKKSLKKLFAGALAAVSLLALAACGGSDSPKVTDAGPGIREAYPGDRIVIPGGAECP